jgi:hypothetical protein
VVWSPSLLHLSVVPFLCHGEHTTVSFSHCITTFKTELRGKVRVLVCLLLVFKSNEIEHTSAREGANSWQSLPELVDVLP